MFKKKLFDIFHSVNVSPLENCDPFWIKLSELHLRQVDTKTEKDANSPHSVTQPPPSSVAVLPKDDKNFATPSITILPKNDKSVSPVKPSVSTPDSKKGKCLLSDFVSVLNAECEWQDRPVRVKSILNLLFVLFFWT